MLLKITRDGICIYQNNHISKADMEQIDCTYGNSIMLESEIKDEIVKEVNINNAKAKEKS